MTDSIPIKMHIKASQTDGQGYTDDTELYTEGRYSEQGSTCFLTYEESQLSGMEGTTTMLELGREEAALVRSGSINTRLLFRTGCETKTIYNTMYGVINFSVFTQKLDIKVCNDRIYGVYLKYKLRMGPEEAYQNEMTINISYFD